MKPFLPFLASIGIILTGQGSAEIMNNQEKPLVVILLGAPGAGKGTHAVELSKKYQIPQISTGDLFRENIRNQTDLGKKAQGYIDKGQLVPDALVLDMLFARISKTDCQKGYILDGFPRTVAQAEAFDAHIKDTATVTVLDIEVSDDLIIKRITGRLVCKECGAPFHKTFMPSKNEGICDECGGPLHQRKDDTEEVVKERLIVYRNQTQPLIAYYQAKTKGFTFATVDGEKPKDEVFQSLVNVLEKVRAERLPSK